MVGAEIYENLMATSELKLKNTCGGEQPAAQRELHAPDGAAVVAGEVLPKLNVLKVPWPGLVRLDPLETGGGRLGAILVSGVYILDQNPYYPSHANIFFHLREIIPRCIVDSSFHTFCMRFF